MTPTDTAKKLLAGLSPRQIEAVTHTGSPLLIVAGPGSGKTRVMAHRVAYLVSEQGIPPWRILAVTFTNKAARELRERCQRLVPGAADRLQVFTFHGFCARVLRAHGERVGLREGFTIYDDDDQSRAVRRILEKLDLDTKQFPPRGLRAVISDAKNKMLAPEQFLRRADTYKEEVAGRVYAAYEEALGRANAVDFDDLLLKTFILLEGHADVREEYQERYQYLLVDEFQDTNPLQFHVSRLLAGKHKNICVVGDPDQSIYSWRHADPSNLLEFRQTYPDAKIVTLDQSYRSTQVILEAADSVIANNEGRMEKNLWTENDRGSQVTVAEAYDEEEEARLVLEEVSRLGEQDGISRSDVAVMYRINAQSRSMEVACNRQGIPYRLVGGVKFYERQEIRDVLAYLRLVSNPSDDAALERIINTPARGIADRTLAELRRAADASGTPLLDAVFSVSDPDNPLDVRLQTRATNAVSGFGDLMKRLIEQSMVLQPTELIELVLERSGYLRLLQDDRERGEERMENVEELRSSAEQYSGGEPRQMLAEFLENVALVSDVDSLQGGTEVDEPGAEAITLITLHQAKGLEYEVVFMIGMEEGLLPHSRSMEDPAQLEEERRLCYVGMTRAKKHLYLLRAFQRRFRGSQGPSVPSRFLTEIPSTLVNVRSVRGGVRRAESHVDPRWTRRTAGAPSAQSAAGPKADFSPGERVRHSHFGDGVVVSVTPVRGDTEVTVAFSGGNGVKRLMLNFAKLEKVEANAGGSSHDPEPEVVDPQFD